MISAYNSLITYKEGEWEDYLEKLCLIDIFSPLLKAYPDKGHFSSVVKYILWAYSVESDMLVIGSDWLKTKRKIFEKACVKPEGHFYEELVLLKKPEVIDTIQKWLEFQDNDLFAQIQILKDLRVEMQISCNSPIRKSSGEIDFSQKFLNAQYSMDLKKMIKDLESELIQNNPQLKDAIKDFKDVKKSAGKSVGMETFFK